MATIIDSFLVTLDSKADSSGFDLFDSLSKRLVVTLGDVINIAERGAKALGDLFKPALEADVIAAKIQGFGYDVEKTWQSLLDMSLKFGTPFQEALDGFTKLKAYGVDPLNGSLNTLKTIVAATGGSLDRTIVAYGQAMAMGSLQGQEKNQFINAGVDIWGALKRYTGKELGELQDMMRQKQITADILSSALQKEAERLGPIANKVAHTLKAQLTNLQTIWYNARASFAKSQTWKLVTDGAIKMVKVLSDVLSNGAVKNAFDAFDRMLFNTIRNVEHLYKVVTDNFPAMVAIASLALWAMLPVITKWVSAIIAQLVRLGVALATNPVYLMVAAIAALVAVLIDLDDAAAGRETVVKWSKDAVDGWKLVKQYILIIADAIQSLFDGRAWDALSAWWDRFMVKVKAGIDSLKLWLTEAIAQLPGGEFLLKLFGGAPKGSAQDIANGYGTGPLPTQQPASPQGPSFMDSLWSFGSRFNPIWGDLSAGGQGMNAALAQAAANKANNQGGTVIHQDNSVKVDANISGVTDPKQVGKEVNDQVKQGQKDNANTQANNKTGVKQ